jgi:hypothetical protein
MTSTLAKLFDCEPSFFEVLSPRLIAKPINYAFPHGSISRLDLLMRNFVRQMPARLDPKGTLLVGC